MKIQTRMQDYMVGEETRDIDGIQDTERGCRTVYKIQDSIQDTGLHTGYRVEYRVPDSM